MRALTCSLLLVVGTLSLACGASNHASGPTGDGAAGSTSSAGTGGGASGSGAVGQGGASGSGGAPVGVGGSSAGADESSAGSDGANSGAGGSSGVVAGAGAGSGAVAAGAGGAASTPGGCHGTADCPASSPQFNSYCLSPGGTPLSSAPGGCSTSTCSFETPPAGNGAACTIDTECTASAVAGAPGTAGLCRSGKCTQCSADDDCPSDLPKCALGIAQFNQTFMQCVACLQNPDCKSSDAPVCLNRSCVECASTTDCATGICNSLRQCVPGCSASSACSDPFTTCSDTAQRCAPIPCESAAECPTNGTCTEGACVRKPCTADGECVDYCVNGQCQEGLGTCQLQQIFQ